MPTALAHETSDLRDTDRLEYFSDAVIAIAATLLSVELRPPRVSGTKLQATFQNAITRTIACKSAAARFSGSTRRAQF